MNFLAGLSLLLCVIVLWSALSRGRETFTFFHRTNAGRYYMLELLPGTVAFGLSNHTVPDAPDDETPLPATHAWGRRHAYAATWNLPVNSVWNRLGFSYWPNDGMWIIENQEQIDYRHWLVPTWFVVGVLTLPGIVMFGSALKRRRQRAAGMCPTCGYDLRASPNRCPECGKAR